MKNEITIDGVKYRKVEEEKKPLYTNGYGTQFFDDDEFSWVHSSLAVKEDDIFDKNSKITYSVLFMGTTRECHRWIAQNWDELNK